MKPKWKDPDYYHKWYLAHREEHLANCKRYHMTHEAKDYRKMWLELKGEVGRNTLKKMERIENERDTAGRCVQTD